MIEWILLLNLWRAPIYIIIFIYIALSQISLFDMHFSDSFDDYQLSVYGARNDLHCNAIFWARLEFQWSWRCLGADYLICAYHVVAFSYSGRSKTYIACKISARCWRVKAGVYAKHCRSTQCQCLVYLFISCVLRCKTLKFPESLHLKLPSSIADIAVNALLKYTGIIQYIAFPVTFIPSGTAWLVNWEFALRNSHVFTPHIFANYLENLKRWHCGKLYRIMSGLLNSWWFKYSDS